MLFVNDIGLAWGAATASSRRKPEEKEKKDEVTEQDVEYRVNSGIPPVDEKDKEEEKPPFDWEWRPIFVGQPQGPFEPPNVGPWRVEFRVDKQEIVPGGVGVYDPHATVSAVGIDVYSLDVAS